GVGTVPYSVDQNFNAARSGTITFSSGNYSSAFYTVNQTGQVSGITPVINSVVTSYGGSAFAQNAWVEIRGAGLVPRTTPANGQDWSKAPEFASGRMPTNLNGISVTIDGIPAYIYFFCSSVTDSACPQDQINVLSPLDSRTGNVQVVVNNNGTSSSPF